MTKCSKKTIKYMLISDIIDVITIFSAMLLGAFIKNNMPFNYYFFGLFFLIGLLRGLNNGRIYKYGFERGKEFAGYARDKIDAYYEQRERDIRLKIQQDLKEHGVEVNLIKEKKKYKYNA